MRSYVSVNVDIEVDLSDIDTEDLQEEIERRQQKINQLHIELIDNKFISLVQRMQMALNNGNDELLCSLTKEYLYEKYNILGRAVA